MKKKIKDLTLMELADKYCSNILCSNCPYFKEDKICIDDFLKQFDLETEVEVNE